MQAERFDMLPARDDVHLVATDGRSVVDVARELLGLAGWLEGDDVPPQHVSDAMTR
jgi:hypothetical protein